MTDRVPVFPFTIMTLILIATLLSAAAGAVEHVSNGAVPRDGVQRVSLSEVWRVGGEDEDYLFGLVPRVETDSAGNVYILDSQMCQVSVFDPSGEFLRTLFREGEGPGEIRSPRDMMVMGDGRVGLIQEFPGTISFVDAQGDPAGRMNIGSTEGGITSLTACQAAGEAMLISGTHSGARTRPDVSPRQNFLERCDGEGLTMTQYAYNDTEYNFSDFQFSEREHMPPFWWCFAATAEGAVYTVLDRDRYAIDVFAADGSPLRTIEREYEPLRRTDSEYARMVGMIESAMAGLPFQPTIVVEHDEAAISYLHRALQLHPDGSLWVLSGRGVRPDDDGVMAVFDVFDQDGVFARQVALEAPHDGRYVGIFLSGPERILVVKGYMESLAAQFGNGATFSGDDGEADLPEVICYQMQVR